MKILLIIGFLGFFVKNSFQISSKLDFSSDSREIPTLLLKSPKIQGVRVTVDTTKIQRSAESTSDENESQSADTKKKIGVRTDVTFELDDEKNESNSTSTEHKVKEVGRDDDDDTNVPIFKGKPTPGEKKNNQKPSNDGPRTFLPANRRNDESSRFGPVFHETNDENYNHNRDWSNFIPPTTLWTTERSQWNSYYPHHRPSVHNRFNGFVKNPTMYSNRVNQPWKDGCDCSTPTVRPIVITHRPIYRVESNHKLYDDEMFHYNNQNARKNDDVELHPGVDDKLEEPFKVDKGK